MLICTQQKRSRLENPVLNTKIGGEKLEYIEVEKTLTGRCSNSSISAVWLSIRLCLKILNNKTK